MLWRNPWDVRSKDACDVTEALGPLQITLSFFYCKIIARMENFGLLNRDKLSSSEIESGSKQFFLIYYWCCAILL